MTTGDGLAVAGLFYFLAYLIQVLHADAWRRQDRRDKTRNQGCCCGGHE